MDLDENRFKPPHNLSSQGFDTGHIDSTTKPKLKNKLVINKPDGVDPIQQPPPQPPKPIILTIPNNDDDYKKQIDDLQEEIAVLTNNNNNNTLQNNNKDIKIKNLHIRLNDLKKK